MNRLEFCLLVCEGERKRERERERERESNEDEIENINERKIDMYVVVNLL